MAFDPRQPYPQEGPHGLVEAVREPLMTRDYDLRPELVYQRLRQQHGPVAPVDLLGVPVWLVVGYDEALQVLRDAERWPKGLQNWRAYNEGRIPRNWPLLPALEVNHLLIQDSPGHQPLRMAWINALQPFQDSGSRPASRLTAAVAAHADELISVLAQGGRTGWADLAAQFSRPLFLMTASHLLGYEDSQGDDVLMDMWRVLDAGPDAHPALQRLLAALAELGAAKRTHPGEDFPSYLLACLPGIGLNQLSRELMLMLGMVADHSSAMMTNTLVQVLTADGARLATLSPATIRETMNRVAIRQPPHINLAPRFPRMDMRLGNYVIPAGDTVMVSVAGAHTDPTFSHSAASGGGSSTRAHLSWGAGPRQCPARELASKVAEIGLGRLATSFDALELTLPADQLPWRSSPLMRGVRSLPVRFALADGYQLREPAPESGTRGEAMPERRRSSLWQYLRSMVGKN